MRFVFCDLVYKLFIFSSCMYKLFRHYAVTNQANPDMKPFQIAVQNALEIYAQSAECSVEEAAERFQQHESTRECIMLLVLAQADTAKLKALASSLR
jgi:hypothetical protein